MPLVPLLQLSRVIRTLVVPFVVRILCRTKDALVVIVAVFAAPLELVVELFELLTRLLEQTRELVVVLGCLVVGRHEQQFVLAASGELLVFELLLLGLRGV